MSIDPPVATGRRADFGRYLVGACLAASVILALLDPSPSRGLGLAGRLAFWLLHNGAGLALFALTNRLVVGLGPLRWLGAWGGTVASGLLGSLPFAPVALVIERLLGVPEELDGLAEAALAQHGWAGQIAGEYLQVVLPATAVWVALNVPWLLGLDFSPAAARKAPPAADAPASPAAPLTAEPPAGRDLFLGRLPEAMGDDLVALSSELQYLRVYTARGKALILHSLREAVDLVAEVPGMQVHRSHWVARDHVVRLKRRGRGMSLLLSNGLEVPVSRANQPAVREAFGERARYARTGGAGASGGPEGGPPG